MGDYGYFDDARREYVITDPRTPVKWINYVGTLPFGGIVDHTGGALLCAGDPAHNRIVKYIPQMPGSDFKGETVYLRVKWNGKRRVFSPFYVPTLDPYERYECRVGLSYQRIASVFYGIRCEVTIFVPPGEAVEVRDIRVTNESGQAVELDLVPVVEFTHFQAFKQFDNADWVPQTMVCEADRDPDGTAIVRQFAFMRRDTLVNYFTSSRPVDSFQTDRKRFLGANEYGTWQHPLELDAEHLSNYEARRGDVIAALMHKLGALAPGESRRLITLLGQAPPDRITATVQRFRQEETVDAAFEEQRAFWDRYLAHQVCRTPDAALNSMVNIHNPRQCHTTMNWSRYLSLYQLGLGARGMGFRDSSQDVMGVLLAAPGESRDLLHKLLSFQLPDGSAMHQFYPATMEASGGDAEEEGSKPVYGDDHLWAVLAVCSYVKETGDAAFLQEEITFYDRNVPFERRARGTVFEHLKRALAYTREHTGRHGLPLLGFADWNDTVNLPGRAESLLVACLYGRALREMIGLARHLGDRSLADSMETDFREMEQRVNAHAWDGGWYVRYFTEDGVPIGASRNARGRIFANAQSWPVLAGFAPPDRAEQALDAVARLLNTGCGIKLSTPGYDRYDPRIGGVSSYPPGAKENGGIFLHANPWVIIAETMQGNGDRAYQYYSQINPAAKNGQIDRYECEPYCYAQNILGDEHPQFGLGRNSWLSGTASWMYQAATQFILGVRPAYDGLMVDPCIPRRWGAYTLTRGFRGATYDITVCNPDHVSRGRVSLKVDERPVEGNRIPVFSPGTTHRVEVVMRPERPGSAAGASREPPTAEAFLN